LFEYRPQPPFDSGSPKNAAAEVLGPVSGMIDSRKVELNAHIAATQGADF